MKSLAVRYKPVEGGVCLLRVYGDTPCPVLPTTIAGQPLVAVGRYCFSEKEPESLADMPLYPATPQAAALPPLCGRFLTAVSLPAGVRLLDNGAFYNCRKLASLTVGACTDAIGSDVFTNCTALQQLTVTALPQAATGLPQLLTNLTGSLTVEFCPTPGTPAARLFYPDYTEGWDENIPAHIFQYSIQGEGYRLRRCFTGGVLCFADYDTAFAKAVISETDSTLCRISLCRLLAPYALTAQARQQYLDWLGAHPDAAAALAVQQRNEAVAGYLCKEFAAVRPLLAKRCAAQGWSAGAALALAGGGKHATKKNYSFDD